MIREAVYRPTLEGSVAAPLRARSTGHYRIEDPCWEEEPRRKTFLELFWCTAGEGTFVAETGTWHLRPGDVFFYFPGDVHRISAQTVPWEYYWMTCDGAHLDEVIAGFELERRTHPAGKAPRDLFARLGLELRDLTRNGEYRAGATAYEILSLGCCRGDENIPDGAVETFQQLVEERFDDPSLTIGSIAGELGIHRSTLARLVRRRTGISPVEYLVSRRIQEAAGLLAGTGLSVKEVAAAAGCTDPNYLAKLLKRRLGRTPTELRNEGR